MNYQEYRAYKESLNLNQYFRLDCMNPYKAMSFIQPVHYEVKKFGARKFIEKQIDYSGHFSFTKGVRAALKHLCQVYKERTLYLPNEVYPVYFDLADKLKVIPYSIFEQQDFIEVHDSMILYTFNHFGSMKLTYSQAEELIARGNLLIIDAIYDYENCLKDWHSLIKNGRCYILNSFSKNQLCRDFGYVLHQSTIEFEAPGSYYEFDETVPHEQIQMFRTRWESIRTDYQGVIEQSRHPYFAVINLPFHKLLEQGILGVPLSVFAKYDAQEKTIVSCLYEIDRHL